MLLVSRVVESDPAKTLDAVIYLIDPLDPSSNFPEALALKRQCVIHGKPFLSTLAGAREWLELEAVAAGAAPDATLDSTFDLANESIALIAHDAMKGCMLALAERHFALLDSFAMRCATGTTGGLLNQLAQKIKGEAGRPQLGATFPQRPAGRRCANCRTDPEPPMPPRAVSRRPACGAPARGGHPAA